MERLRNSAGFSLMEAIIGIALAGVFLTASMGLMNRNGAQQYGQSLADAQASFHQAAGQYYIAFRSDIDAALDGDTTKAGTYCKVNVNPADGSDGTATYNTSKRTCAFDTTMLATKKYWPTGSPYNLPGNAGRFVAILRRVTDSGGSPTQAAEMLIVQAALDNSGNVMTSGSVGFPAEDKGKWMDKMKGAMTALGASGGFIPPGSDYGGCQYNSTKKEACGNGWKVDLASFLN
jgi:hypothetical protein